MTPLVGYSYDKVQNADDKVVDPSSKSIEQSKKEASWYRRSSQESIYDILQLDKSRPSTPEKFSLDHLRERVENSKNMINRIGQAVQFEQKNLKASEEALAKIEKEDESSVIHRVRSW